MDHAESAAACAGEWRKAFSGRKQASTQEVECIEVSAVAALSARGVRECEDAAGVRALPSHRAAAAAAAAAMKNGRGEGPNPAGGPPVRRRVKGGTFGRTRGHGRPLSVEPDTLQSTEGRGGAAAGVKSPSRISSPVQRSNVPSVRGE